MRFAVWIVIVLVSVVALVALIGWRLPKGHSAMRTARLKLPPDALYTVLSDVDTYKAWRPNVKKLERLADRDGRPAWVEETSSGRIPLYFERMERPSLLVARIADPSLPFGGRWTYRISPAESGSALSITEDGEVYNPLFRFLSRFVFGYTATMDTFIKHLQVKVTQSVER